MAQQTAIDWLIEQWPILESKIPQQILEQAKQMELEQIEQAYKAGFEDMLFTKDSPSDYYTQTYGQ